MVEEVLLELVEHEQQLAARRLVAAGRERNGPLVEAADPLGEKVFQLGVYGGGSGASSPSWSLTAASIASASARSGSSRQPEQTTSTDSGMTPRASADRARSRKSAATPARRSELLPTPLAP